MKASEARKLTFHDKGDQWGHYFRKIREAALKGHYGEHFHCKQDEYPALAEKFKALGYEVSEWWSHGPMSSSDWSGIRVMWGSR